MTPEFENRVAELLGPRYVWALHTEPVRILMQALEAAEAELEAAEAELEDESRYT